MDMSLFTYFYSEIQRILTFDKEGSVWWMKGATWNKFIVVETLPKRRLGQYVKLLLVFPREIGERGRRK